jgi:hypothetical protein
MHHRVLSQAPSRGRQTRFHFVDSYGNPHGSNSAETLATTSPQS